MKTRKLILLALALLSAVVAYAQPSTRIDLTQLVAPADTSKVNFVITEGDTAYYEYQVPSLSFDITTEEDAVPGMLTWNTDESTLDIGLDAEVILQTGQEMVYYVKNQTGSTINDGQVVQFSGSLGNSDRLLIALARADTTSEAKYIMGVATEEIANGADGFVTAFGKIRGIDTDGSVCSETWGDGDVLYLSATTAGCLTVTPPAEPSLRIPVAAVVHAANNGTLFVRPTYYPKLDDLHDVTTDGATNGQVLVYNSSSGVWEPGTASGGSSLWSEGATSGEIYYNSGNVGIGTTDPRELLDIDGGSIRLESSSDPGLRIYSDDGAEDSYLDIRDFSDNYAQISKTADVLIDGFLDIDVLPLNNTKAIIRVFRNTNTTDVSKLEIYKGNNSSTRVHRFATNTETSFVNSTNNVGFGVGTSVPTEELDVFGDARIRGHLLLDPQSSNPTETDEGIFFYDNVDNRFSGYSEGQYRDLAWADEAGGTGWLKDSLEAGDVTIAMNRNQLSFTTDIPFTGGTDTLISLSSARSDVNIKPYFLSFNFGNSSAGFVENDTQIAFYNTVNGEGLAYEGDYFNSTPTNLLKDRQIPDIQTVKRIVSDSTGGDSAFWEDASGTVRTVSASSGLDFVFGSSSLDDTGTAAENERFFFDNSKGYFFAGVATTDTTVNDADRGLRAINLGYNNSARATNSSIGGGIGNLVTSFGTSARIGGGDGNIASNLGATIGGGIDNESGGAGLAYCATVGGGQRNTALERFATTSGGIDNINSAQYGTIGGGRDNDLSTVAPAYATIPGGLGSKATIYGSMQHSSGNFDTDSVGQAQNMQITVRREATGVIDFDLFPSGNNPSVQRIEIEEDAFWSFTANCITVVTNIGTSASLEQGDSRAQTIFGKAENDGGTIRVDYTAPALTTFDDPDGDMTGTGIALSPDSANNALTVTCTPPGVLGGGTGTTVTRAVCTFLITQLKY